jgi:hypothetical protein
MLQKVGPLTKSKFLKRKTVNVDSLIFVFVAYVCKICSSWSKIIPDFTFFYLTESTDVTK